ncbi:MAG: histidinol-phosphate transaminase [Oscillospiraceae bacterium]|nr:histidinol-phosphate transaminase [Oscillospiraceae bacterium]
MSRFLRAPFDAMEPYVPGEQPRDKAYIKLNTNESPFSPSPGVLRAVAQEAASLKLYSDPECTSLRQTAAELFGISPDNIFCGNGSDEVLNFAFMAFCGKDKGMAFPSISYGFYPVFANLYALEYDAIPLKDDFTVDPADYFHLDKNIVIANPNAPTGLSLSVSQVRSILDTNRDNLVILDEAYVDFGGESCLPLIREYDNLLVVQTFSKSRSLAGARLGFGLAQKEIIADLNKIKYSTNPYNINRETLAAGEAALREQSYYDANCKKIMENRDFTAKALEALGFEVLPSKANFLFARTPKMGGEALYLALKDKGILVRHFSRKEIADFLRITIGSMEQMQALVSAVQEILK